MGTQQDMLRVKGYAISPELFRKGFPAGGGPCRCTSRCCSGGVYVDLAEHREILGRREQVKPQMDPTQTTDEAQWFEPEPFDHTDFPSGRAIGTQEINGKCAFLDGAGRCALQLASVAAGEHKWSLKPLYCILYPIEISDGVVGFDDLLQGDQGCCSVSEDFAVPLFQGCREELTHLLGEDGYAALERHYDTLRRPASGQETP